MKTAVLVLIVCAATDLFALGGLLAVVGVLHWRVRREAAAKGEVVPSAAGQFGCLLAVGLAGFGLLCGVAWLLARGT